MPDAVTETSPDPSLSILTAPEGAVQSGGMPIQWYASRMLSILTAPEGAVQLADSIRAAGIDVFQSSPPPKERCNEGANANFVVVARCLSILTAPEGAVQ